MRQPSPRVNRLAQRPLVLTNATIGPTTHSIDVLCRAEDEGTPLTAEALDSLTTGATSTGDGKTCRTCRAVFNDLQQQRDHFKTDWHRLNVKRAVKGAPRVTEAESEQLLDDASTLSGSGTYTIYQK